MSNWGTLDGRILVFEELPLQHLVNIYWYHKIVSPNEPIRIKTLTELQKRAPKPTTGLIDISKFLFPYIPHTSGEVEFLKRRGLVIGKDIYNKIGGRIIGHLKEETPIEEIVKAIREEINLKSESNNSNQ